MGLKWFVVLIGPLHLIGMWFGDDRRAHAMRTYMFERDWTTSSNISNYAAVSNEHNWEDLRIRLRNQQTCTSNNRDDEIRIGSISDPVLGDVSS